MLRFAVRNLISRPVRSLLSLLGLTVAILGMVALFSVAEGIERSISTTFGRIPGLVAMQPGSPIPLFSSLPAEWEQDLATVPGVHVVNAEVWQRANVINGKMIVSPPRFLFGTVIESRRKLSSDPYRQDLVDGRFLEPRDVASTNTVISRQIADEFGVEVGGSLKVNGFNLTVVGIYHCDSILLDVAIILDVATVRRMTRMSSKTVSAFYIEPEEDADSDQIVAEIKRRFRGRQLPAADADGSLSGVVQKLSELFLGGGGGPVDPFQLKSLPSNSSTAPDDQSAADERLPIEVAKATEWGTKIEKLGDDLDILLTILTGIGVTIAVLSIINTMLMSVTERIIEFGILKANGWSHTDVLKLITLESGVLGLSGGILGCGSGWLACQLVNQQWSDRIELYASPRLLLFSVVFSTMLGILGGLYPAFWATRMSPMEAIRRG